MSAGGTSGTSLRRALFEAGKQSVQDAGEDLKKDLAGMTGSGKSMDTAQSLELQFKVGEYSNLAQTVTGMEKMMKDSIAAAARNTT